MRGLPGHVTARAKRSKPALDFALDFAFALALDLVLALALASATMTLPRRRKLGRPFSPRASERLVGRHARPLDGGDKTPDAELMKASPLPIVRDVAALRAGLAGQRKAGRAIGLVPTMGALHEGHLSLVRAAKQRCDHVVASLFVNPRQFAPHEDFDRYPRDEAGDAALLAGAGCDLLYAPERVAMYPDGFATNVIVTNVSTMLEGPISLAGWRRW